MSKVDQRVVEMKFDQGTFKSGIKSTLDSLDQLKKGLQLKGASAGLDGVDAAAKRFSLQGMMDGLKGAMGGFSALGVVAATTLASVTHSAITAGSNLVKSLTLDPVMQGFSEYELKMGSIQTIMANTARHGTSLDTVNEELNKLNKYADKTIYNFAEMTKNASLFTNSGMKIEDATTVIKGFSNSAAASGTSAEGAAGAAYQLSQAMSAGMIRLQDWRSMTNVGMGGKNMQDGIIMMAQAMGTFTDETTTAEAAAADFNGSLEKKWLTADVMSTYLKAMSGDMDDAALAALGLNAAQIETIRSQATMGLEAATKVRTLTQLMGTLKEAVASGWTESFELIFGNFTEATDLFTGVSDTIGGMLARSAEARNKLLQDWKDRGGRDSLIDGIRYSFEALMAVIKPIKDAFRSVFPATTGKDLERISDMFREFAKNLRIGETTAKNLKRTFAGVFSIFKILLMVVKGAATAFFSLFTTVGEGGSGLLGILALWGDFISSIQRLLTYTGAIEAFFAILTAPLIIIKPLIALISDLVAAFSLLFAGDVSGFTRSFKGAFSSFGDVISDVFDGIKEKFDNFTGAISGLFKGVSNTLSHISKSATKSGNNILGAFAGGLSAVTGFLSSFMKDARGTVTDLIDTLQSASSTGKNFFASLSGGGLDKLVSLIDLLKEKFNSLGSAMDFGSIFTSFNDGANTVSSGGLSVLGGVGSAVTTIWNGLKDLFSGISGTLGPLLSSVSSFFTTLIEKIRGYISGMDMADAVSLLNTGFFIALYIALRKFTKNLSDIVGKFGDMADAISDTFGQLTSTLKTMQSSVRATMILKIAVAVGILVASLYVLAKIDPQALKQALIAMGLIFLQLGVVLLVLTKYNPASFTSAAAGLILMAIAIRILVGAVQNLGEMDPDVLKQGAIALGVMMAALAGMVLVLNKLVGIPAAAAGLLILAGALMALSLAIRVYAAIDWGTMLHGLARMVLTLVAVGLAMRAMPKSMIANAAGLVILSGALVIFAGVIAALGALPYDVVKQGLIVVGIALGILAGAANLMKSALPGAAAILVMAAALTMLVPVLAALGSLDLETIGKGLLAIAGIFAVLAIAGLAAPAIGLLGAAMLLLGAAFLAAGLGVSLFATGIALLAASGAAGFAVIMVAIQGFLNMLPLIAQQVGHAMVAFALVIAAAAPKIMEAAKTVIIAFLNTLADMAVDIYEAGLDLFLGFLRAIKSRIADIVNVVIDIVSIFLDTLAGRLPKIIQSGVDFVLSFIEGLAEAIRGNKERTGEAGADLAKAIVEGMIEGLKKLGTMLPEQIKALGTLMVDAFKKLLGIKSPSTVFADFGKDIVMGLINGIGSLFSNIGSKAKELGGKAIAGAKEGIKFAADVGKEFVNNIIKGITVIANTIGDAAATAVRTAISTAKNAISGALDIGKAIVNGIADGISKTANRVKDAAVALAQKLPGWVRKVLGIESPSKEFALIGKQSDEGLAKGLDDNDGIVKSSAEDLANTAIKTMRKTLDNLGDALMVDIDNQPVIRPILDLTDVQRNAGKLAAMIPSQSLAVTAAYARARNASESYQSSRSAASEVVVPIVKEEHVTFEQHNHSPKALSHAEIYRQTRNQLSTAKGVLVS